MLTHYRRQLRSCTSMGNSRAPRIYINQRAARARFSQEEFLPVVGGTILSPGPPVHFGSTDHDAQPSSKSGTPNSFPPEQGMA